MATTHDGANNATQDAILIIAMFLLLAGIISLWFFV